MARLEDIRAEGQHKIVTTLEHEPNLVRCTFKVNYQKEYGTYLLWNITHTLFPTSTPQPISFGREEKGGRYYMDVERVPLDAVVLNEFQRNESVPPKEMEHNAAEIDFYRSKRKSHLKEKNIIRSEFSSAGLFADITPTNWSFAEGRVRYLDAPSPWGDFGTRMFNERQLRAAIAKLPEIQKKQCTDWLNELVTLETKSKL